MCLPTTAAIHKAAIFVQQTVSAERPPFPSKQLKLGSNRSNLHTVLILVLSGRDILEQE